MPSYPAPPFFDPTLNAGFVAGRGTGGGVTYGDPEIGGRPPRYQNWNAGLQHALARTLTRRRDLRRRAAATSSASPPAAGAGSSRTSSIRASSSSGNLLTQQATAANIAAAQAIVPGVGLPYANFSGTIAQMLRPFPQYSGVTDVYGNVARSTYHSLQLTAEKRRSDDGLIVNFNYTFSRTEDNLATRTAYDFDQDWAVGVNDQPHVWNALVVYNVPFGAEGKPGSGNAVVRAIVKDWQISGITQFRSGRPLGSILAACNLPNAGTCYADFNPAFTGAVRINGDYGDGDVLGANPPSYIDRAAFQSPRAVHLREHAADARLRSAQPELLQPGSQRAPGFPHLQGEARARPRRVQCVQQRRLRGHPDQHHQRELRQGELADQHAARRADQGAARVLIRRYEDTKVQVFTQV